MTAERFTTILWSGPEETSRRVWVERTLGLMRIISDRAGATRFDTMDDNGRDYEVPIESAAIESEIELTSTGEVRMSTTTSAASSPSTSATPSVSLAP